MSTRVSELGEDGTNDLLVGELLCTNELQVWFLSEHPANMPLIRVEEPAAAGAAWNRSGLSMRLTNRKRGCAVLVAGLCMLVLPHHPAKSSGWAAPKSLNQVGVPVEASLNAAVAQIAAVPESALTFQHVFGRPLNAIDLGTRHRILRTHTILVRLAIRPFHGWRRQRHQ